MKLLQISDRMKVLDQAFIDLDITKILCMTDSADTDDEALNLAELYYSSDPEELSARYGVFSELTDTDTVAAAYQSVASLREELDKLSRAADPLHEVLYKFRCATGLQAAVSALKLLTGKASQSRLAELKAHLTTLEASAGYKQIAVSLDDLAKLIRFPHYMSLGINAREDGDPVELAVLGDSLENTSGDALLALSAPSGPSNRLFSDMSYTREHYGTHLEEFLMRSLEKHYHSEIQKAQKRLQDLDLSAAAPLLELEDSLKYYLVGMQIMDLFTTRGYELCRPDPKASDLSASALQYPDLALHMDHPDGKEVVLSTGSSTLITGANHSGKTSYLKTVGQSLVLAQFGFFVPAKAFCFRPFVRMHTLFSAGEDSSMSVSRMGVEIQKLSTILKEATSADLVLINEPMTSTNPVEAVSICSELMEHFLDASITHLVVTHLYDIYYLLQSRLSNEKKARMVSLVTESRFDEAAGMIHSYKLTVSAPRGNSYALETAKQFGITISDLLQDPEKIREAESYCNQVDDASIYGGGDTDGLSD